mgnify:CR=1 FL=1
MSYGIRCWNENGGVVFDSEFLSLRVIDIVRVYAGMRNSALWVSAPKCRSNHAVIVQARTRYGHSGPEGHRGYNPPIVTPYDGYLVLEPISIPSSQTGPGLMDCSCDIVLVALS